jgi:hypothetical protein
MWQSVRCPQNFTCTRRNASYWQCTLLPGRTAPSDAHFDSSNQRYAPVVQLLPPTAARSEGQPDTAAGDSSSGGNSSRSSSHRASDEAIVPVCGPDTLRGNSKMCNRTSQYILPLDQINATAGAATSAAGSSRATSLHGLAQQLLRLGAVLLAAAAGSAAVGI